MNTAVADPGLDQIKTELLGLVPAMLKLLQAREALRHAESEQQAVQATFASLAPVIKQLQAAGADFDEMLAAVVAAAPSVKPEILRAALMKARGRPARGTRRPRARRATANTTAVPTNTTTDATTKTGDANSVAAHESSTDPASAATATTTVLPASAGGDGQGDAANRRRRRGTFMGED